MSDTPGRLLIYHDAHRGLGPLTRRRASFELRTGAVTTLERIERVLGRKAEVLRVPDALAETLAARLGPRVNRAVSAEGEAGRSPEWLVVNGRWAALDFADRVAALRPGQAWAQRDGAVVAACLGQDDAFALAETGELPDAVTPDTLDVELLYTRPWDVVRRLPEALAADLERVDAPAITKHPATGVHVVGDHPVYLDATARVVPPVTFDATLGPIAVDQAAELRPFVTIQGPAYVGPHAIVGAHASLRANTSLGPHCRVGGELSHSVIQGYTNKAHAGYLGNAYVGEWCNLGADTTVSNLKNTYGHVRTQLEPDGEPIDTGLTHQGPILGDVVRTAIGTLVPTGACLDLGASVAVGGFAPKYASPFSWWTDDGPSVYGLDRFLATLKTAMSRRHAALHDAEAALIAALHERYTADAAHPQPA